MTRTRISPYKHVVWLQVEDAAEAGRAELRGGKNVATCGCTEQGVDDSRIMIGGLEAQMTRGLEDLRLR